MRNKGIVEVLACKDKIQEMLLRGCSVRKVHTTLYGQGIITTKYSNFHNLIRKFEFARPVLTDIIVGFARISRNASHANSIFEQKISPGQPSVQQNNCNTIQHVPTVQPSSDKQPHFSIPRDENLM